jgi:hypothetical protein
MNERKISDDLVIKVLFFCAVNKYEIFMRNEEEKDTHICSNGDGLGSIFKNSNRAEKEIVFLFH